jgi:hypothetical protein
VPVHTVVLADTESGTIVADPTYDLMFPKQSGGYHDVREMTGDPGILISRLRVLRSVWGPQDKISDYEEESHRYDFVTTVNWSKYSWLKVLASALRKLGWEPRFIRRPALLENPKLLFVSLSSAITVLFAILGIVSRMLAP